MAPQAEEWFGNGQKAAVFGDPDRPFLLMVPIGLLSLHRPDRQVCWSTVSFDAFQEVFL